jgi:pilus assembly protein FimV
MSLRYVMRVLLLAGLMPTAALALGLGDIHLKSALNAPLDADIDLTASGEELAGLKVTLASRESFSRYGLDYPAYLASVTMLPAKAADGHDVVHVRSSEPVTEPFATLLIEANWARGRLVREYTVLLDPPVFTGERAAAATVAAPATATQSQAGAVNRPSSRAPNGPQPEASGVAPAPAAQSLAGGSYTVQRGDTLSTIAARNYPNSQRERALVALYRANGSAFAGNMNELRTGASLQLPDASTVAAIGPGEAKSEVTTQYRAWAPAHPSGQLRLVAPSEPASGATAGAHGSGESAALQQRVTQLQSDLNESHRLLELRNAELARLQAQINGLTGHKGATTAPPPVTPAAVSTPAPAPAATPAETAAPTPTPAPTPAPAPAPKPKHVVPPAPAGNAGGSLLGWLADNWAVVLGALAILAGGVFGWRALRSRQSQAFDRTLDRLSSPPFEAAVRAVRPSETQPIRALQPKEEPSFVVEESGTHEAPRINERDVKAMQAAPVAVDDTVSGDTAVALDQGDPLAEADFHMAYGLYDQAADLVRIAIAREPQRRDLKLKLLEVFFVWGNKDQFLQLARELSTTRDQAMSGEWEKIVIMGRQIAPDDALFAASGSLPGAASGGVDLNLEGGQNRVDFDLLGEPSIVPEAGKDRVDLDLGAALGDNDSTGELRAIGDTGVDFMLDDPARGVESTGSTREMPQSSHTVTLEFTGSTGEVPTVEQPRVATDVDHPTIRQKLDATASQALGRADQTAELALDDLGLDLSAGDTGDHVMAGEGADSAPTMLTSLDEDTRTLLARAEAASGDTAQMPTKPGESSGTWLFTDKDFSSVLPAMGSARANGSAEANAPTALVTAVMPRASETGITNQIAALKETGGKVDLNLSDIASTANRSAANLDLDVGTHHAPADSRFTETQRLAADPGAAETEPATMSEVGTKLDLARAYMDMGDPEGARSILDEVLSEGSASQKTEARRLIDSLPG